MIEVGGLGLDSPGSGKGLIAGCCELDNKYLGLSDLGE
jgi:hypothetical protein